MHADRTSPAPRFAVLDGLRGLAALFVFLFHYDSVLGGLPFFSHGYLAVDFFFMLSGFVLTPQLEQRCREGAAVRYIADRVARLWPIMAVGACLGYWVTMVNPIEGDASEAFAFALLFLPSNIGTAGEHAIFPLNIVQWSLLLELLANAAHVALLWRLRTRWLLILLIVSMASLAAISASLGSIEVGARNWDCWLGLARIAFCYGLGCVMGRHAAQIRSSLQVPWWVAAAALSLLLAGQADEAGWDTWRDPLSCLLFAPVIVAGACASAPPALDRLFAHAGRISWPLYAVHFPLLRLTVALVIGVPLADQLPIKLGMVLIAFVLAFILARTGMARRSPTPRRSVEQPVAERPLPWNGVPAQL